MTPLAEFAFSVWLVGMATTAVGLSIRRCIDVVRECNRADAEGRRPEPQTSSGDTARILFWPIFLWRPW